jgi:hypothetical protein
MQGLLQAQLASVVSVGYTNSYIYRPTAFQAGHVGSIPIARCVSVNDTTCQ